MTRRTTMDDIVTALRLVAEQFGDKLGPKNLLSLAADEIERLRAERDELRREVCCAETTFESRGAALLYAKRRGWDCFRDDDANYRGILGNSNSMQYDDKENTNG
jgi:hypothetical protein